MQKITTKEPTPKQIEVAIGVVKKVLQLEKLENSKNEFSGVHRQKSL